MQKISLCIVLLIFAIISTAQIHVRDEPRHHNVFENEFIRILDVFLGPNDTTLYHLHNTPSVFIILANSNVASQLIGELPQKGANVAGIVTYDSMTTPRVHRVWNDDTSWFHVMDIELIGKNQTSKVSPLKDPSVRLLFNEQQVNGYAIELKPRHSFLLPSSLNGYLLVSQTKSDIQFKTNGKMQVRKMNAGHYIWIEGNEGFSFQTLSTGASFVLLQLK